MNKDKPTFEDILGGGITNSKSDNKAHSFGAAIELLKTGAKIARLDKVNEGSWLSLSCAPEGLLNGREVAFENLWSKHNSEYARLNGGSAVVLPCITEKTANGEIQMGWTPTQQDMFAEWVVLP